MLAVRLDTGELKRPYLVHALVTRIDVPTTSGSVSPTPPAGFAGNSSRSRHSGKGAKGSLKDRRAELP
jgi:hypothetical protein